MHDPPIKAADLLELTQLWSQYQAAVQHQYVPPGTEEGQQLMQLQVEVQGTLAALDEAAAMLAAQEGAPSSMPEDLLADSPLAEPDPRCQLHPGSWEPAADATGLTPELQQLKDEYFRLPPVREACVASQPMSSCTASCAGLLRAETDRHWQHSTKAAQQRRMHVTRHSHADSASVPARLLRAVGRAWIVRGASPAHH